MVHTVHDGIRAGAHIVRALRDEGEDVKETLPAFAHGKGAMRGIPVVKKCLRKERQIPHGNENNNYGHKTTCVF